MDAEPAEGTVYEFVIEGELGDRFACRFEGLGFQRREGTTVLTGRLVDQAQLSGVLAQIQELGLELVSVDQPQRRAAVPDAASPSPASGGGGAA
jgi:hypothetical protein